VGFDGAPHETTALGVVEDDDLAPVPVAEGRAGDNG